MNRMKQKKCSFNSFHLMTKERSTDFTDYTEKIREIRVIR